MFPALKYHYRKDFNKIAAHYALKFDFKRDAWALLKGIGNGIHYLLELNLFCREWGHYLKSLLSPPK